MQSTQSEAVDALRSIIGRGTALSAEASGEAIRVSIPEANAAWSFHSIDVGRLDKNHVSHQLNRLESLRSDAEDAPEDVEWLLISDHVTAGAGDLLREEGVSYLDASGNCFLQSGSLFLFIQGQKPKSRGQSDRPVRAFNAAGLKLIFALLVRGDVATWTYREIAELVEVSRGTVGYVMNDLEGLGFIEKRAGTHQLRKRTDLMDRWATGYTERLRPKLSRGRFQFLPSRTATGWQSHLSNLWATKWGGEPGADLLTGAFRPELLTLYTREDTSTVCQELEAAPDPEGSIEILDMFWDPVELEKQDDSAGSTMEHVPPLLIYADLVASADPRARRAAKKIWNQYLVADET